MHNSVNSICEAADYWGIQFAGAGDGVAGEKLSVLARVAGPHDCDACAVEQIKTAAIE